MNQIEINKMGVQDYVDKYEGMLIFWPIFAIVLFVIRSWVKIGGKVLDYVTKD